MAASGATGSLARAPSVFHRGVTDAPNAAPFWQDLLHWQASGPLTPGHALLAFSQADAFTRWLEHPQAPPALCQALQAKAWGLLPGLHRLRVPLTAQGPLLHLSLALGTEAIAACDFPAQTQAPAAFTPDATRFDSTKRHSKIAQEPSVHPNRASFKFSRHTVSAFEILSPNRSTQAINHRV